MFGLSEVGIVSHGRGRLILVHDVYDPEHLIVDQGGASSERHMLDAWLSLETASWLAPWLSSVMPPA